MKYRILRRADKDIEAICNYIAQDNVDAADRLDERLHAIIQVLAEFPKMGHRRADVSAPEYLFWVEGNYVIAYRTRGKTLHGRPRCPRGTRFPQVIQEIINLTGNAPTACSSRTPAPSASK